MHDDVFMSLLFTCIYRVVKYASISSKDTKFIPVPTHITDDEHVFQPLVQAIKSIRKTREDHDKSVHLKPTSISRSTSGGNDESEEERIYEDDWC